MKYRHTEEEFESIVKTSQSFREVMTKLGIKPIGGNYKTVKLKIKKFGLDTSHFTGMAHLKGKTHNWTKSASLEDILVKDSPYTSVSNIRRRLIREGLFSPVCSSCGLSEWLNKPISLELDHVNGINDDHRIENLRILCPNCHAQTPTYRGKNRERKNKEKYCPDCNIIIHKESKRCHPCAIKARKSASGRNPTCTAITRQSFLRGPCLAVTSQRHEGNYCIDCDTIIGEKSVRCKSCSNKYKENHQTKIDWPSNDELKKIVSESSYLAVSRQLGVSDNAIRKRLKKDR